jgi:hypothetical protein
VFDEARNSLTSRFPDNSMKIRRMFDRIMVHFYESEVRGHERLIGTLGCRDEEDEHVMAGAIQGKADFLITYNTRDFPNKLTRNLVVIHPDSFLISWVEANPQHGIFSLAKWLERFENPPIDARGASDLVNKIHCPMLAAFIRRKANSIDDQIQRLRSSGPR